MTHRVDSPDTVWHHAAMPETNLSDKPTVSPTLLSDALRNPLLLAKHRAEIVQLATERASKLAADARTRVEGAANDATARVRGPRRARPAPPRRCGTAGSREAHRAGRARPVGAVRDAGPEGQRVAKNLR